MIRKTSEGYQVVSHSGKPLSDNDLSYMQAKDRLREVEFFKRVKAAQDGGKKLKNKKKPSANTGYKTMDELLEMKKQQEAMKTKEAKQVDKSLTEKLNKKTNINEPNPISNTKQSPIKKEKPFEHFERIKKGFNKKYQQSIDKVLYGR